MSPDCAGRALLQQQLPPRKSQLYNQYGPGGPTPLIPEAQPGVLDLSFGRIDSESPTDQKFVEVLNPSALAVDVSGYRLTGPVQYTLATGEQHCIPPLFGVWGLSVQPSSAAREVERPIRA